MNRLLAGLILASLLCYETYAQVPAGINFQAVVRDEAGSPIATEQLVIELALKNTTEATTVLYRERHSLTTNSFGQLNLVIGKGFPLAGDFASLPWSTGSMFFDATATLANGKGIALGTHQLNTVPFAFYSNTAKNLSGPDDIDNENELIEHVSLHNSILTITESATNHTVDLSTLKNDADANPTNEFQQLSLEGTLLSLSNGNAVDLISLGNDADASPTNEIQSLQLNGNTLTISGANSPIYLAPYLGNNATTLQLAYTGGNTIQLTDGSDFAINTSTGAPLITTSSANARVGIGTNTPLTTLDIVSNAPNTIADLKISNSDGSHRMTLYPGRVGDTNPFIGVSPNDPLRFAHYNGTSFTERFRMAPNGNLGIGTTNPLHKIHVVATTSPYTPLTPTIPAQEAAFVVVANESDPTSLNNVGIASQITGMGVNYGIFGEALSNTATANRGVFGQASGSATTNNIGVYGNASGVSPENIGVRGLANGGNLNIGMYAASSGVGETNHGVYATASGATTNWAGYFDGAVNITGNATISGTTEFSGNSIFNNNTSVAGTLTVGNTASFAGNVNFASGHSFQNSVLRKGGVQLIDIRHSGIYAGNNAGNANTGTAFRNIAIGSSALAAQTTGSDNLTIGENALQLPTTATWNIALGSFAMGNASGSLSSNLAIGPEALENLSGSSQNIALGLRAMEDFSSGNSNIAIGVNTMDGPGGGSFNVAIGSAAATVLSTGNQNIMIGRSAGTTTITGSDNILIGSFASASSGATNAVAIGANAVADASNAIVLGSNSSTSQADAIILGNPSNGNARVGIGTNAPNEKLHLQGNALINGNVFVNGMLTATTVTESDFRFKKEIKPLFSPLETISKINGVSYYWKTNSDESKQYGVIAQDIEKVLPDIVKTNKTGYKAVNYTALIPFLIEAIKEQQKQIDQLKNENRQLTTQIQSDLATLTSKLNEVLSSRNEQQNITTDEK